MNTLAWPLVVLAGCAVTLSGQAAADPTASIEAASTASGSVVSMDVAWPKENGPWNLKPLRGSFTVTGFVVATAVADQAASAIVAVPQRRHLPTQSRIRSDIPSGRAADLVMIGGFAGGALVAAAGSVWAEEGAGGDKVHRIDHPAVRTQKSRME